MPNTGLIVYVVCIAALVCGTWFRPPVGLAAVFCMYGLDQLGQVSNSWLAQHSAVTNVLVGAIVVVGLFRKPGPLIQLLQDTPKETWLVAVLYVYAFASLVWTPMPARAWEQWQIQGPYVVTIALASPLLITQLSELRTALRWALIVGGALVCFILFYGHWGTRGIIAVGDDAMTQTNPLALASLGGIVASAAVFTNFRSASRAEWIGRAALAVVCLSLILRSGSRGQLVAIVVALVVMLPIRFRLASASGFFSAVVFCAIIAAALEVGFASYVGNDDVRWTVGAADADALGRLQMAAKLLAVWSQSALAVLFGLGNTAAFDPHIVGFYPHIMPLEVLGEEGLLGFGMLVVLLIATARKFNRARGAIRFSSDCSGVLAAIATTTLFSFLLSLKEGSLLGNNFFFMSALLLIRASDAAVVIARDNKSQAVNKLSQVHARFSNLLR